MKKISTNAVSIGMQHFLFDFISENYYQSFIKRFHGNIMQIQ